MKRLLTALALIVLIAFVIGWLMWMITATIAIHLPYMSGMIH